MLPATRHKRAHPTLTPAIQAGTQFTDPERMEGWVNPGQGCKEQLVHGCYQVDRTQSSAAFGQLGSNRGPVELCLCDLCREDVSCEKCEQQQQHVRWWMRCTDVLADSWWVWWCDCIHWINLSRSSALRHLSYHSSTWLSQGMSTFLAGGY